MSQAEDEYWQQQIITASRTQLDTVRKSATGWSALYAAVLGVFGTVTFVSGLTGLGDLSSGRQLFVRIAITVAMVAALGATVLSGVAAGSVPHKITDLTEDNIRNETKTRAESALRYLRASMICGAVAAVVVLTGSLVVLFSDKAATAPQTPSVITEVNGHAVCGIPTAANGSLGIDGVSLDGAGSITVVPACPAKP